MPPTSFANSVYELTKQIPKGQISTYKNIAIALGKPKASQAVGQALRKNPFAPLVPCHRVISTDFSIGGFFGTTSLKSPILQKKIQLLKDENIQFHHSSIISDPAYRKSILFVY